MTTQAASCVTCQLASFCQGERTCLECEGAKREAYAGRTQPNVDQAAQKDGAGKEKGNR